MGIPGLLLGRRGRTTVSLGSLRLITCSLRINLQIPKRFAEAQDLRDALGFLTDRTVKEGRVGEPNVFANLEVMVTECNDTVQYLLTLLLQNQTKTVCTHVHAHVPCMSPPPPQQTDALHRAEKFHFQNS